MKRVLLVAYYFPPLASAGTFRALRLAKYLPRAGWDVTVLSVTPKVRLLKDPALERDIPETVPVLRTPTLEPRNALLALHRVGLGGVARRIEPWFMAPDDQRGWVPFARAAARRAHAATPFDAVITTSAPYSAHLVGLAMRRDGLPWLADFRDEWTTNPFVSARFPTGWHRHLAADLERTVIRTADRVASVSGPCLAGLRRGSPDAPDAKFVELPNGFDAEHFAGPGRGRPDRFRIAYTGIFYGHHAPRAFLDGLARVVGDGRVPRADVEVIFAGHAASSRDLSGPLPAGVTVCGHLSQERSIELMRDAAVLLLVLGREQGGPGIYTSKLFHYLAAGRPILAIVPSDGVAADLVRRSRAGVVVPPDDPDAIAEAIALLYRQWRGEGEPFDPDPAVIAPFEARRQTADWARVLDAIAAPR